ncbi:NUMOD4 motif-containing HNH endonuclease [Dysgonomonas sp. ZJ279]|uniref:NUMOD4 motif-containing HNH endonuclease n=1 Tax=Dysgonomonas sp. ZJ279 TaxID=2709796 RepID=UPI0013EDB545|nr:NUMOD4 motif-containing HNH endonuclease [Dysgonomonas sp. ZJ279]
MDNYCDEIWKDIIGFENFYQISNCGNVRSLERLIVRINGSKQLTRSVLLKPYRGKTSVYYQISLSKKSVGYKFLVHRLVAQAFLKDWDSKLEVNHMDGNKHNNNATNLEMCTRQGNIDHSIFTNLKKDYGEKHVHAKLTNAEANKIRNLHKWGIRQVDLAGMYGVAKQTINNIIHFKSYIK